MDAIIKIDRSAVFHYWGGPKMAAKSSGQIRSISETSFMGFYEVLKNFKTIHSLFKEAKRTITDVKPDMLILIDYPGFNLRILEWAKSHNINTTFYISPQLWAWKKNRYKKLRDFADLFFVILPFEKPFFDNLKTPNIYYGHPLTEIIKPRKRAVSEIKTIGLFPGSRPQEIAKHLTSMVEFSQKHTNINFIIAGMSHCDASCYNKIKEYPNANLSITYDDSYHLMQNVDLAITSSGTATLELALFNTPQIVVYKTSDLSFYIGKKLINLKYISLVNLIADYKIVDELIQTDYSIENIEKSFQNISPIEARQKMISSYEQLRTQLGEGRVSESIAQDIFQYLKHKTSVG